MLADNTSVKPTRKVWFLVINHENEPIGSLHQMSIEDICYIDDLREHIKQKESIDVSASQLKVWRYIGDTFSENHDEDLKSQVSKIFLDKKVKELQPMQKIADLELFKNTEIETFLVKKPNLSIKRRLDRVETAEVAIEAGDAAAGTPLKRVRRGSNVSLPGPAASKLDKPVNNPSMTASRSNDSGFTMTASTKLKKIYTKAWNKDWPSKNRSISTEACELSDDDPMQVDEESNSSTEEETQTHWDYKCLLDINELSQSLEMVTNTPFNLVVRKEYMFICEALEIRVRTRRFEEHFVLTGQPGIGKTIFLLYLLLHRLKLGLPTAIQVHSGKYVLFDQDGVAEYPEDKFNRRRLNSECWALCDSNQSVVTPCLAFQASGAVIIQATPPELDRWKQWSKQKLAELIVMDLPCPLEIAAIAQEAGFKPSQALAVMQEWGPSARTILCILGNPMASSVERDALSAAREVAKDPEIVTSLIGQQLNSNASTLLFVRPHRENCSGDKYNVDLSRSVIEIPTPSLSKIFDEALSKFTAQQRLQLFAALSPHSLTRNGAGWAHELNMHNRMCQGGKALDLCPNGKIQPSKNLLSGTVANLGYIKKIEDFYWLPSVADFQGVDSVLGNKDGIYALQAAIAKEHSSPIEGLRKIWSAIKPAARGGKWHFVIVTDNAESAKALHETFARDFRDSDFALGQGTARVRVEVCCCVIPGFSDRKSRSRG